MARASGPFVAGHTCTVDENVDDLMQLLNTAGTASSGTKARYWVATELVPPLRGVGLAWLLDRVKTRQVVRHIKRPYPC